MKPEEIRENADRVIYQKGKEGIEVVDLIPQEDPDYVLYEFSDNSTVLGYKD